MRRHDVTTQPSLVYRKTAGFTLIEILVVIGIIALLATIVILAINPARQFAQARDTQRTSNLNTILNAIGQRTVDHKGMFRDQNETTCLGTMDPLSLANYATATIASGGNASSTNLIDMRPCLVPVYISELPLDPVLGVSASTTSYNTGYLVAKDPYGRIHLISTSTESSIPRTAPIEVVR